MRRRVPLALAAVVALLLAACGSGAGDTTTTDTATPGTTAISGVTTTLEQTTSTGLPSTTSTEVTGSTVKPSQPRQSDGFPASGDPSYLVEVYGSSEQVTFQFDLGSGTPEWSARYVEEPVAIPSGQDLDVEGDAFLEVTMQPASGVDLSGDDPRETFDGSHRFSFDSPLIEEVVQAEDFESTLTWVVGLDERVEYRVERGDEYLSVTFGETAAGTMNACTNPEGFSISYPDGWVTNDGSVVAGCGWFDPVEIQVEEGTDARAGAITAFVDPVDYTTAASSFRQEESRAVTLIDGHRAVRVEHTGSELYGEAPVTTYVVEVDDRSTLFLDTLPTDDTDYTNNVAVLDAMARTVEFTGDDDGPAGLIADYRSGGQPFQVTLGTSGGQSCLIADPGDSLCLTLAGAAIAVGELRISSGETVVAGLASDEVFRVEVTTPDGSTLSYLPVEQHGTSAWVVPFEDFDMVTAFDTEGDALGDSP